MEQQIIDALTKAFDHAQVELDRMSSGRYSGRIVWEGFGEEDAVDRQRRIRQALRDALHEGAKEVSVILAYTPHEMQVMSAA